MHGLGFKAVKVVLEGYHSYFLESKLRLLNLHEGDSIYAYPNHTDDGIHSDHGYLDTWDNPLGPP